MRNFEPDLMTMTAQPKASSHQPVYSQTVAVEQTVTVTPRLSQTRAFVAKEQSAWEWSDLRDFVVSQIEQRFGAFPRDAKKESAIFKSFLSRHGDDAVSIAKFVFEIEDGYWAGAPVSVNRFCKASDPYFADKIKTRLVDEPVTGW